MFCLKCKPNTQIISRIRSNQQLKSPTGRYSSSRSLFFIRIYFVLVKVQMYLPLDILMTDISSPEMIPLSTAISSSSG